MSRYLTTKLTEESAEVAQAACKLQLRDTPRRRKHLLRELGDLQALINLYIGECSAEDNRVFHAATHARVRREKKKGKA